MRVSTALAVMTTIAAAGMVQPATADFDPDAGWVDEERHSLPEWEPGPVPDPNGFDVYREACRLYQDPADRGTIQSEWIAAVLGGETKPKPPKPGQPAAEEPEPVDPGAALAVMADVVDACEDVLDRVHAAGQLEYASPVVDDFKDGLPWLKDFKELARLVVAGALVAYDRGEVSLAFQRLEDGLVLSARVAQDGVLIEHLVGKAIFDLCRKAQALFLDVGGADADELTAHARRCREIARDVPAFGTALLLEARATLTFVDRMQETGARNALDEVGALKPGVPDPGMNELGAEDIENMRTWIEDRYARMAEAADEPAVASHIHRLLERTAEDVEARGDPIAPLVFPAMLKIYDQHLALREAWVVVQLRPALEAYRVRHGELPTALEDLTPEIIAELPPEPWTGDPPLYERVGAEEFMLYSPGFDGVDDGGETSLLEDGRGPDIVLYPE
ncbi:MAG: hypothetical protein GF320_09670 [Armatimonadia bacterium]|nr:hypothetical protein [Armatimonadia bacterium]